MRFVCSLVFCLVLHSAIADVSELVRSGNGFVYDVPVVPQFELEADNSLPTEADFGPEAVDIPVAPSDEQLAAASEDVAGYAATLLPSGHGYQYQKPSKAFDI